MDIIDDDSIFNPLCEYLNSLLCVIDFDKKNDQSANESFNFEENDPFFLPINESQKSQIYKSNYQKILLKIIRNIQIPKSCIDIFRSEFDDELVMIFIVALRDQTKQVTIEEHDVGYKLNCPAMISDLIMPLLSQFHSEVLTTFENLSDYIKAVDGNTDSLFLNAKNSNPVSQYIQLWVSKELDIPERPLAQGCFVV